MAFKVFLTEDASSDLEDLYNYIFHHDSPESAEYVLSRIEKTVSGLAEFPERGACPDELLSLGIRQYREIFFKPYRIIYQIIDNNIYVMLIVDGRRDMQSLLQSRLLKA